MKKLFFTIALAAIQMAASAQTVNVHFKNGQKVQFNSANVDYVDFSEKAPDPTVSAGAVVDLGLSVYWCSCNVGAEAPEEYGDFYAWGETKTKSSYTQDNYSYYDASSGQYIKIGNDICGTEYDAATVNLGSDWRMPTQEEIQELVSKCTWEWTQINSVNGYRVISDNGNSIFLPASGIYYYTGSGKNKIYQDTKKGVRLWSGTKYYFGEYATSIVGEESGVTVMGTEFPCGLPIRSVTTNPNATGGPVDHSNDYLVTDKVTASFLGGAYSMINGKIQGGSKLNVKFNNGSSEQVTLIGIQLIDASNNTEGNNLLDSEIDVAAGEAKSYTVTVGYAGITTPVIRFTYRYNKKKYTAEATLNL